MEPRLTKSRSLTVSLDLAAFTEGAMGWRDEEIELLRRLHKAGASATRAALALKRAKNAVRTKARELGIPFETIRHRRKDQRRKEGEARARAGLPPQRSFR